MQLKRLLPLALTGASLGAAQTVYNPSLSAVLASQSGNLSKFGDLLAQQPDLLQSLGGLSNITILAPTNAALGRFEADNPGATQDAGLVDAILTYHVLNGTWYTSNLTSQPNATFIPTLLTNTTFSNVTGGQRVFSVLDGVNITFGSGNQTNFTIVFPVRAFHPFNPTPRS